MDEPSASILATKPGFVSSTSPGKTTVDPPTSRPLTDTPPSLCNTAEPVSAAASEIGHRTTIIQQTDLRNADTLIAKSNSRTSEKNPSGSGPDRLLALWMPVARSN